MRRAALILLVAFALLGALPGGAMASAPSVPPIVVTFATADGSTFRTVLTRPDDIVAVLLALVGDGRAGIPSGTLAYGDGGVNAPHQWHMQDTILVDVTIELCDGTAAMVDADVTHWVETVGTFCPWSAVVIAVAPLSLYVPG